MIALDTETTGLVRPDGTALYLQPFITEISAIKFDARGKILDEFNCLIKPPVPISEEITRITGITNEMLEREPQFVEIYPDLCEFFLGESVMFAHNVSFDHSMFKLELQRIGKEFSFPWPRHQLCTVELSMPIKNKRMKLGDLYRLATGKEIVDAHRARNDVLAMIDCIIFLRKNEFIGKEIF